MTRRVPLCPVPERRPRTPAETARDRLNEEMAGLGAAAYERARQRAVRAGFAPAGKPDRIVAVYAVGADLARIW